MPSTVVVCYFCSERYCKYCAESQLTTHLYFFNNNLTIKIAKNIIKDANYKTKDNKGHMYYGGKITVIVARYYTNSNALASVSQLCLAHGIQASYRCLIPPLQIGLNAR